MAKAFKCDGCRQLNEGEPVAALSLVPPPDNYYMANSRISVTERADLCSRCAIAISSAIERLRWEKSDRGDGT